MKIVPLIGNKYPGLFAIVDDCDFNMVMQYKWHARKDKNSYTFYATRKVVTEYGKLTTEKMHRFILGLTNEKIPVDHKNALGLDNTRINIRSCAKQQNNFNARKPKTNKSGFKGVSWNKEKQKFTASISVNNKKIYLGAFDSAKEASNVYNKKAKEIHGEFYRDTVGEGNK